MSHQSSRAQILRGLSYAAIVVGYLYVLAWVFRVPEYEPYFAIAVIAGVYCYLAFNRLELTQPWGFLRPGSTGSRIMLGWLVLASLMLLLTPLSPTPNYLSHQLMVTWLLTTPLVIAVAHYVVRYPLRRMFPSLAQRRRAVIVFANDSSRQLAKRLGNSEQFELIGYFEDRDPGRSGGGIEGVEFLGRATDVVPYVQAQGVDVVFVILPDEANKRVIGLFEELGDTTASVYYVPDFIMFLTLKTQLTEIEGIPAIQMSETPFYGADGWLKRVFDIFFASFALLLLALPMLGVAIAVKLSSPGPVFFKQRRYGLNGKAVSVYKFRSMVVGDAAQRERQQATKHDPRVTRVGAFIRKTSIDELPQFFNVLRGDMSVVGPRPHSVAHNEQYRREIKRYMARHKVKPGLTGWAQVNGLRGETAQLEDMEARISHDLDYIDNWSPVMDLKIIFLTIWTLLRPHNVY